MLGDVSQAKDLVQDTVVRLWRYARQYDPSRVGPGPLDGNRPHPPEGSLGIATAVGGIPEALGHTTDGRGRACWWRRTTPEHWRKRSGVG